MKIMANRTRERLTHLRNGMLRLHKSLLDSEKAAYERDVERITTTGQYLNLVLNDPWFAWLRPMTALIVQIDEWLDGKEQSPDVAEMLLAQVRDRMRPDEEGAEFQQRYHRLLQEEPAVAVAHAQVRKLVQETPGE